MSSKINIAIVVAGGIGARFGGKIPKQFTKIKNKEVIEYCVDTFANIEEIAMVIVVCHKDYILHARELFAKKKKICVILGGNTRFESSFNALEYIRQNYLENSNVLIHDAARPLISREIILNCIEKLNENCGVIVAMPAIETVSITQNGIIEAIPERKTVFMHQTPQCFWFGVIYASYKKIFNDSGNCKWNRNVSDISKFTDDCSVCLENGIKSSIILGSSQNKKVTTIEDLCDIIKFLKN